MDDGRPIFLQIAESLESQILDGTLLEEEQIPSINALAAFHRINPATALKGVTMLVDAGTLYKRRGIGMFVAEGSRERLRESRRAEFRDAHIRPLAHRAQELGLTSAQLHDMITKEMNR
ncbi:GntR family transcriptional regulator [Demequina sp. B12]|uniref:GntR family transcriptional regulator n=1 Tax=Demequina sp. B12 TaxID=2992757 RepID=UPI00237B9A7C|nr:GntR family transcriptional regulator [Demequina sp. B12]MDE0573541.1 GntR family transcriptional regulator [Demequina sp. B12]